jgi:hypothetical protein
MKVKELVATLLTLPQEAEVYTEQWTSNKIAEVAVNRSKDVVIIGDDLDGVIEDVEEGLKPVERVFILDEPVAYIVHLESLDEGIPYNHIESYSTYEAARECLAAWVADEKEMRSGAHFSAGRVQTIEDSDYYSWRNTTNGSYSEIWIQEEIIREKAN